MKLNDRNEIKTLCSEALVELDKKKLESLVLLDLGEGFSLADYFIIATANSTPQLSAGISAIYRFMKNKGFLPIAESNNSSKDELWALIDYGFLVVHIFTEEGREFYDLDGLYSDAIKVDVL